jgi:hypothetical protein
MFLSHAIFTSAAEFTPLSGREDGIAERSDWMIRVSDRLVVK